MKTKFELFKQKTLIDFFYKSYWRRWLTWYGSYSLVALTLCASTIFFSTPKILVSLIGVYFCCLLLATFGEKNKTSFSDSCIYRDRKTLINISFGALYSIMLGLNDLGNHLIVLFVMWVTWISLQAFLYYRYLNPFKHGKKIVHLEHWTSSYKHRDYIAIEDQYAYETDLTWCILHRVYEEKNLLPLEIQTNLVSNIPLTELYKHSQKWQSELSLDWYCNMHQELQTSQWFCTKNIYHDIPKSLKEYLINKNIEINEAEIIEDNLFSEPF